MKQILHDANLNQQTLLTQNYGKLVNELINKLPTNRNQWVYGYAEKNGFKSALDRLTNLYLKQQTPKQVDQLIKTLQPISKEYERAYGNPNHKPTYAQNKLYGKDGLYYKFGNNILKTLKIEIPQRAQQYGGQNISPAEAERLTQQSKQTYQAGDQPYQLDSEQALALAAQSVEQYLKMMPSTRPKKAHTIQQVIEHPTLSANEPPSKLSNREKIGFTKANQDPKSEKTTKLKLAEHDLNQQLSQASHHTIEPETPNHKGYDQLAREYAQATKNKQKNNLFSMRRIISMMTGNLGAIQAEINSEQRQKNYDRIKY